MGDVLMVTRPSRAFAGIGQRNVELKYLAISFSVHGQLDLVFTDVDIVSHHLQNILLKPWQEIRVGGVPPLMGHDNLESLLCHRG